MSNRFHLAVPVLDLVEATSFYCDFLACTPGSCEAKKWQDINFWGNELTLHYSNNSNFRERHNVDMGEVCVPHFGIHLIREDFNQLKERIINNKNIAFFDDPYLRFLNDPREQETFFIEDPSKNVIEIKTMKNPETLFHE
jgi:extradiol dioxygenase family protein|tara:strand:+ start:1628 stop:2047 length:420 start_codon:yes stop_codon:yes gene_type:complete